MLITSQKFGVIENIEIVFYYIEVRTFFVNKYFELDYILTLPKFILVENEPQTFLI